MNWKKAVSFERKQVDRGATIKRASRNFGVYNI